MINYFPAVSFIFLQSKQGVEINIHTNNTTGSTDGSTITGAGVLVTTCGAYNFNVTQGNSTGSASPTGSGYGASPTGSTTGLDNAGRTNGVNLCIGTGSLLIGVGA